MDETKEILLAIKHSVEVMDAKITRIEHDITEIKSDIAEIKSDVTVLKSDVSVLKSDVSILKSDVTILKSDSADLKKGQLRQERLLETLCLRSLEQENIVRDLQLNQP